MKVNSGKTFLYSGNEYEGSTHSSGVEFMLSREAMFALVHWDAVSDSMFVSRFKTEFENTAKINVSQKR